MPPGGLGMRSSGQPLAGATFIVGSSVLFGGGSVGFGPTPASNGSLAISPHATTPTATPTRSRTIHTQNRQRMHIGFAPRVPISAILSSQPSTYGRSPYSRKRG